MQAMQVLAVGKPLIPGRTSFSEAVQYHFDPGIHQIQAILKGIRPEEIKAVKSTAFELAYTVIGDIIFMLWRFEGGLGWSDCPFTWHLNQGSPRLPRLDYEPGMGAPLNFVLVDASTGIIRALSIVGLGNEFTKQLHQAIRDQSQQPFDEADYDRQLLNVYERYDIKQLLDMAKCRYRIEAPQ